MKKILKCTFVAAFVAIAGFGVYTNQRLAAMSEIALANVEALADSEIKPGDSCYSDATYDADEPLAVKCGNPCVFEPLDIPWFFPSTSYCL